MESRTASRLADFSLCSSKQDPDTVWRNLAAYYQMSWPGVLMDWWDVDRAINAFAESLHRDRSVADYWASVRSITEALRTVRYPSAKERDDARVRFESLVSVLKERRAAASERSSYLLEQIRLYARYDRTTSTDVILSFASLATYGPEGRDLLLKYEEHLKYARDFFMEKRSELTRDDSSAAYELLRAARESLNDLWGRHKQRMAADAEARHAARKAASEQWRARQMDFLRDRERDYERIEAEIGKLLTNRQRLQHEYDNARSGSYRERMGRWIVEGDEKISQKRSRLEGLARTIREVRDKLSK